MPRVAAPRLWKDRSYVTEAGGKGVHILCRKEDGLKKAKTELSAWLEKWRREKEDDRRAGLVETDSPFTVGQLAAEFLDAKKATKPAQTVEFYRKNLVRLNDWYGGTEGRKLQLTHAHQYILRLKDDKLSACTINHHLRAAKAVFNYAVQNDRLRKNPWKGVDELPEWGRRRIVTDEEFEKLLKASARRDLTGSATRARAQPEATEEGDRV
jgi:hypothetical protein